MSDYLTTYAAQLDHAEPDDDDARAAHGEIWEPPGMWKPKVGDRVRIRLSAECRVSPHPDSTYARAGLPGHLAWEDGRTGEVTTFPLHESLVTQGHRYTVLWDAPRTVNGERVDGGCYAACELTPLTDDPARPSAGQQESAL